MPTTTRGPRTARPGRSTAQSTGRFARQGASGQSSSRMGRTSQRPSGRKSSSGRQGLTSGKFGPIAKSSGRSRSKGKSSSGLSGLTSMLPGLGGSSSRKGKAGGAGGKLGAGMALFGAAAMALKNRDKLAGKVKERRGSDSRTVAPASGTGTDTGMTTGGGISGTTGLADPTHNGPASTSGFTGTDPDAPGLGRTSPA